MVVRMILIVLLIILKERAEYLGSPGRHVSLTPEPCHLEVVGVRLRIEVLTIMCDTIFIEGRISLGCLMVKLQKLAELGRIEIAEIVVPAGRLAGRRSPPCRAGRITVIDI